MKKARSLSILVVISFLGILAADGVFFSRSFFVETAYAKARTCADFGRAKSCAECNQDQLCKNVVEMDGPNKLTCSQCRDKRSCSSTKLLTQIECASCVSDQAMICAPHGKDEFFQKCFECRKKKGGEIDCAYFGMPAQCPECSENKVCQPVEKSDDKHKLTCYQCRDKSRCEDRGLLSQSACSSCMDDRTMICAPKGRDDFSQDCFECRKKKDKEIDCKYYGLPSQCPPCLKNEVCETVKTMEDGRQLTCYQCRKGNDCKDLGFFLKAGCASCMDDPTSICASKGNDDFGQPCYECREKQGKEIDCRYYGLAQTCEKCTADEVCESEVRDAGEEKITCRWCRPKRDCSVMELLRKEDCPTACETQPGMICVAQGKDEFLNTCYGCVKKETCQDLGFLDKKSCDNCVKQDPVHLMCEERAAATGEGTCYECIKKHGKFVDCDFFGLKSKCSACGEGVRCDTVKKENEGYTINCYECKETRRCRDLGLLTDSDCRSCLDSPWNICVPKGVSDTGTPCFECRKKEGRKIDCVYYGLQSSCQSCGEDLLCRPVDKPAGDKTITCYECAARKKCKELGMLDTSGCASCIDDPSKICTPIGADEFGNKCFECKKKEGTERDCAYFGSMENCGSCPEGKKCTSVTQDLGDGKKITCYECKKGNDCLAYGLVNAEDCAACIELPNMICVPKGKNDFGEDCYDCREKTPADQSRETIITVTWIIVIVEDCHVRVVLQSPEAGIFEASAVMVLMKADGAKLEQVKQLAQVMQGGGISTVENLQDFAKMLSGLSAQKSLSKDPFKDFSEAPLPQTAPQGQDSFGSDERKDLVVNGPIVATGKLNGKDALSIFDAGGRKVATFLKSELNPDSLSAMLQKAQELSDQFFAASSPSGKEIPSQSPDSVVSLRSPGPEQPTDLDPDDPLYYTNANPIDSEIEKQKKGVLRKISDGTAAGSLAVGEKKGPDIQDQWGIRKIGFTPKSDPNSAWNVVDGSQKNILVAVIDSGIDLTHPDGPQYIWLNKGELTGNQLDDDGNGYVDDVYGWNFLDENNGLSDLKGHGTFIAGIIAAKTNNGLGIAGINPGAVIMPLKVANGEGETNSLNIYRAIMYAVQHGARIINVSLGGRGVSQLEQSAINYAYSKNVFVAMAAGNVAENIAEHGPASSLGAFVVGALDYNGKKSPISNWGANNGLIAPAEMIYSLRSKDSAMPRKGSQEKEFYYLQSGTSFSTPMVAATASLLFAKDPQLTNKQIEDILLMTADDMGDPGWDDETGAGVLNAAKALRQDPDDLLAVKINFLRLNRDDKNNVESLDVFGTVRGALTEFSVELGRGKNSGVFKTVAGPFRQEVSNSWIVRIDHDVLKESKEWIVQISAKDRQGMTRIAQSLVTLKKSSAAEKHDDIYYGN